MTRAPRRAGITLVEVLMATAILAIGMLAIMALFPIGAVNMARAINQNRAADHAMNSDALFRFYWKNAWLDQSNGGGMRHLSGYFAGQPPVYVQGAADIEPMMTGLDGSSLGPNGVWQYAINPGSAQPSFPVLVDPVGWNLQGGQFGAANKAYVAGFTGNPPGFLPSFPARATIAAATQNDPQHPLRPIVRNTTLLDELSYDGNGEPASPALQIERGGRYSAAWLIQRPKNNVPQEVNLTVLIYAGRSPTDTASPETVYLAVANGYQDNVEPKPRSITLALGNQPKPAVLKGKWIAFATPIRPDPQPPGQPGAGVPYMSFHFYRIAAVQDGNGTVTLELEQPLKTYATRNFDPSFYNPQTGDLGGFAVVFENLFEVFERGVVSASAISGR